MSRNVTASFAKWGSSLLATLRNDRRRRSNKSLNNAEVLEERLVLAAAVTWRAGMSSANNFVLNATGNSGAELSLSPAGAVTVRPSGTTLFALDTSGNLSLAGSLTTGSSWTLKENFVPADGWQSLEQLASLPLWRWNYITDTDQVQHLGPTAEDFYATFGLGADAQHLAPTDLAGVLLPGVQTLSQIVDQQDAQIASLLLQVSGAVPSHRNGNVPKTGAVIYGPQLPDRFGASTSVITLGAGIRFLDLDQVIPDDLIVQRSIAIGTSAINGENFGSDTLRLKEQKLRIHFDDTSLSAGFPNNDWRILINDLVNGGTNHFSVEDTTAARVPFRINAGAPNNSLLIAANGNAGLGTVNPVRDLHIAGSSSPGIRLQQDNSAARTPQTWDVAGSNTGFSVRDVTAGRSPFVIKPGAPTGSVAVAANGNVGFGTVSPQSAIHVSGSDGNTQLRVEEATTTSGQRNLVDLRNNGPVLAKLQNTATNAAWQFGIGSGNAFIVGVPGAANPVLRIAPNGRLAMGATPTSLVLDTSGNLTIAGTLSTPSSRGLKENFAPVDGASVLSTLKQLPVYRWNYVTDTAGITHFGPIAEEFYAAFGLGPDAQHLAPGDVAGVTLAAIQSLSSRLQTQGQIIQSLTSLIDTGDLAAPAPATNWISRNSRSGGRGVRFLDLDQVIPDDLIVQGSAAVGLTAMNGEVFSFDTLRLKSEDVRVHFDDTSAGGGAPGNDWRIIVNDAGSGGANHFSIQDATGNKIPFRISAGAPTASLVVGDAGVGLGTAVPQLALHLRSGNSPAIRLQQTGVPQSWDVAGNASSFLVRDVTGGSKVPFRIRQGAPTSSVHVLASGNVGIGTASAASPLNVVRSNGTAQVRVQETSGTSAPRDLLALRNTGGTGMSFTNTATSVTWRSEMSADASFRFDLDSTAGSEFKIGANGAWTIGPNGAQNFALDASGNLTIAGTLSQGSSRAIKENFVPVDVFDTLHRLEQLPVLSWNYMADPDSVRHVGPVAEDFYAAFGLGKDAQHLAPSDLAAVNLAGFQALLAIAGSQGRMIENLSARLGKSWSFDIPASPSVAGAARTIAPTDSGISSVTNTVTNNSTGSPAAGQSPNAVVTHEDAGFQVHNDEGRIIGDVVGAWTDHNPGTPDVVDIWYDFRSEGGVANQITAEQMAVTRLALAGWEAASGGLIRFTRNTIADASQIINIGVGDMQQFGLPNRPGGILGIGGGTLSTDGSRSISNGVAWLDGSETWDTRLGNGDPPGTIDFFSVVAHEFGHALGVGHISSPTATDILSKYYRGEINVFSADNRTLIQSLYRGLRPGGDQHGGKLVLSLDQVVADDLIVQGSTAIGFDAANGENFGNDTLRLKENNLQIHFEDTSTALGFSSNDWRIIINDAANGGAGHFSIADSSGNTVPFRVSAGALTSGLVIGSTGHVGLGTLTPLRNVHLVRGNTPGVRLEQDASASLTPQKWDFAGNESGFFIRDVSSGNRLPFRIKRGATNNSLLISGNGDVGVGTASPLSTLHVRRTNGSARLLVQETSGTTAQRKLLVLINNGAPSISFTGLFDATANISLSTQSGSEAQGTSVTITATASSPVIGNKTVNVVVSGKNITTGDYTLTNATITIPNGSTVGSTTLNVVADGLTEGTETAIISLANPSSGLALGTTLSANLTITDNPGSLRSATAVTVGSNKSVPTNTAGQVAVTRATNGGADDDILFAGRTTSDAVSSNLNDLREKSISANRSATRTTNLRVGLGSSRASLNAKVSVLHDPAAIDTFTGGGTDGYLQALDDVITDLLAGETLDLL